MALKAISSTLLRLRLSPAFTALEKLFNTGTIFIFAKMSMRV